METMLMEPITADEMIEIVRIPMSKAEFLTWQTDDDTLYEFDKGFAEPADGMKKKEFYLVRNIQRAFRKTTAYSEDAILFEEADVWVTDEQKRIPDVALFTDTQISAAINTDTNPVPAFVIELISEYDLVGKTERKVLEYFAAGVETIWHVHPDLRMVRVFTSPRQMAGFFEDDVLSAAPALPDMTLTVNELFAR
jgi:Uma2 family endonuclease